MLAYFLAIAVGLSSLALYIAAFFFPEVHRQDDFLWGGVGLFYALVLWVCAGRITGGVLLGQAAAVSLIISFGWQSLILRKALLHPEEKTSLLNFSLVAWLQNKLFPQAKKKTAIAKNSTVQLSQPSATKVEVDRMEATLVEEVATETVPTDTTQEEIATAEIVGEDGDTNSVDSVDTINLDRDDVVETVDSRPEAEEQEEEEIIEAVSVSSPKTKKGFSLDAILSKIPNPFRKQAPKSPKVEDITKLTDLEEGDRSLDAEIVEPSRSEATAVSEQTKLEEAATSEEEEKAPSETPEAGVDNVPEVVSEAETVSEITLKEELTVKDTTEEIETETAVSEPIQAETVSEITLKEELTIKDTPEEIETASEPASTLEEATQQPKPPSGGKSVTTFLGDINLNNNSTETEITTNKSTEASLEQPEIASSTIEVGSEARVDNQNEEEEEDEEKLNDILSHLDITSDEELPNSNE